MNEQEYNAARERILQEWQEEVRKIPDDDVTHFFNDALYSEPYRKLERKYIPLLKALEEEYRGQLS